MRIISSIQKRLQGILPVNSLRERFARGVFWAMAGTATAQALNLLSSILVARLLGKAVFGGLGMILSTVGMFGTLAGLGLGLTGTKYIAEFRASDPERAGRIIGMAGVTAFISGILISGILFGIAPYLAARTLSAPALGLELRISCGMLLFSAMNGNQIGALAGFEAFKTIAKVNLLQGFLNFPLLVGGAYWGGLPGIVAAYTATSALAFLINRQALRWECRRAKVPIVYSNLGRELPILWKFSLPALLSGIMVSPVMWLANTFLVNQPNGYQEMGIFSAANQWRVSLLFIPTVLGQVVMPMMSNTLGAGARSSARKLLLVSILTNFVVIVLPAIIIGILSPWIMSQYGEGFRQGWPVLIMCLIYAGVLAVLTPVGNIIAASGRMWVGLFMNLGWATALLVSVSLLIERGALGLASSYAIAYAAHSLWALGYALVILGRPGSKTMEAAKQNLQKIWSYLGGNNYE